MKKRKKKAIQQAPPAEENVESKKPSLLVPALLLGSIWTAFIYPWIKYQYWQSDTFWLIETGRLILQNHAIPAHDPYSYTSSAAHWFVYQWLTEVLFALAEKAGGLLGLAVVGGILFGLLFCGLMFKRMVSKGTNPFIAIACITFCAWAFYPAFSSLRPQLISFVLFWLTAVLCAEVRSGMALRKAALFTFIIALLWANFHISFLAGLVIIAGNIVGTLHYAFTRPEQRKMPLYFLALYFIFVFSTYINPYGTGLWYFVADVHNLFYTQEVSPLNWMSEPHRLAVAILGLVSAGYLFWKKQMDAGSIIVLLLLLAIGNNCSRLFTYFCLFACPMMGAAATSLFTPYLTNQKLSKLCQSLSQIALSRSYLWAVSVLSALIVVAQPVELQNTVPVQAAKYLAEHPVKGHLFSTAHAGSYLIYSSHGSIPVFMDTRVDLYDPDLCFAFIKALYSSEAWQEMFKKYKIAAALLPNDEHIALKSVLEKDADWKVEYQDRDFTLFTRKTPPESGQVQ